MEDLPADWLARLPGLVKADFPFRPLSPVLVGGYSHTRRLCVVVCDTGATDDERQVYPAIQLCTA